jgi:hypothetical protein
MEHERAIADCMAERGFEYIAALPADVLMEEARASAEAQGRDLEEALTDLEIPEDPNETILASLPPDRAEAHADAYWGDGRRDGCYYATYEQAWGVDVRELGAAIDARLPAVEEQIASDSRVVAARAQFVECMRTKGYTFSSVEDVWSYPSRVTSEAVARINGPGGGNGVPPDHPEWRAHERALERFESILSRCEEPYAAVVRPIENDYLTRMADDIRHARE